MSTSSNFINRLEKKIHQQLKSQRVGYLLGAGASHLNGSGYPLTSQLWTNIQNIIPEPERSDIQTRLDGGSPGIEQVLDELDQGGQEVTPHRNLVTSAIASYFLTLSPPLESHSKFLQRLSNRPAISTPIFCLNYDPLIERSSDLIGIRLIDGFTGFDNAFFNARTFQEDTVVIRRGRLGRRVYDTVHNIIRLYKLHGSVSWYIDPSLDIHRCSFNSDIPNDTIHLMIPPQHRKAIDTTAHPYSALWSDFRKLVRHGPSPLNRLIAIGYGMRDEHVNAVIENGLARSNFIYILCSQHIDDVVFQRWNTKDNVIIITQDRCSLYGETGPGHSSLWDFIRLIEEL